MLVVFVLVNLLVVLVNGANETVNHHEYFDYMTCSDWNYDYCERNTTLCSLKFRDRMTKAMNIGCVVKRPVKNLFYHTTLYYRFSGVYKFFLMNVTEDVCGYLSGKVKSIVLELAMPHILKKTNFKSCPMIGPTYVKDLRGGLYLINNQFVPAGEYRLNSVVLDGHIPVIKFNVFFNVPLGKSILDYSMG